MASLAIINYKLVNMCRIGMDRPTVSGKAGACPDGDTIRSEKLEKMAGKG